VKKLFLVLIIVAFFISITGLFVDLNHNWHSFNEATFLISARECGNFMECSNYPFAFRSERKWFTHLPLSIFLISRFGSLFGFKEWAGRTLILVFGVGTTIAFYSLMKKMKVNKKITFLVIVFISCSPLFMHYNHNIQSDMIMLFFLILSFLFFDKVLMSSLLLSVAVSVKPSAIIGMFPLLFKNKEKQEKIFLFIPIVFFFYWIFIYSGSFRSVISRSNFRLLLDPAWYLTIGRYFAVRFPYFVFIPFYLKNNFRKDFWFYWTLSFLLLMIVEAEGSFHHDYYLLPLIFPLAVYSAKGFIRWGAGKKIKITALVILVTFSLSYTYIREHSYEEDYKAIGNYIAGSGPAMLGPPEIVYYSGLETNETYYFWSEPDVKEFLDDKIEINTVVINQNWRYEGEIQQKYEQKIEEKLIEFKLCEEFKETKIYSLKC